FIKNFKTKKVGVTINYVFFTKELSTLIQSVHGIKDLTQLDTSKLMKTRNGTNILQNDYLQKIKEIAEDVGIKGNIKTHAFRKYFSSQVRKCKHVDDEFKEHLMGHVSYNLAQAYNNNLKDIAWYYNNWKKLETLVCVDCIVYDHTSKKVKNLEDKYNNIVKETTEKDKKISQLEEQNKKLMEKVSKMEKNIDKINEIMMKVTDSENAEIKRKAHEELGTKKTEKQIKKEAQINKESKEEYEETLEK
ncbi:MAG: tyrosine-type recombinase/integrase, partial [Minisyncoccales bacterium]